MKKITFTTALVASTCAFGGFEGHVTSDGYVPGLQQGIFRNGGRANVNFYATCAEADRFSHTLGTILADANRSGRCQVRNELTGAIEKWEENAAILYEGEMYFEGGQEYNFFGCIDDFAACQLDGAHFWYDGISICDKLGISVFSKTFKESGWHPIRVWLVDALYSHGAWSERIGFQGVGIGWNTNGCKVVNATTQMQWNRLLDDGSGRLLRSKVLPQKSVKQDECGPVGAKDGEVRTFGAQDGLPIEIEMVWVAGRGEVDGFWVSKNRVTQRQWKIVMGYNPVDKDKQEDDAPIRQLSGWGDDIIEFLWCLNARYAGVGRFARLSDAQWQLAAKYCTVGLPLESASLRIAFRPTDKRNSEREVQKLVKRGSDIAFEEKLAKGDAKRYSLADGLDLDMIKVEGCGDMFYLGRYEVTQEQYEKVMASNPSHFIGVDNLPVSSVTWTNAMEFCVKLNALVPVEGMTWTLPSSKQWAFAANGGLKKKGNSFFGGDDWREVGWWNKDEYGCRWVRPVGLKKPNELGFHDHFGNVWEWCGDGDGRKDVYYLGGPGVGHGKMIEFFVLRNASQTYETWGFRVALVPVTQQVVTVTDTEGKETIDGYTWSYRVKNGEAEIVAEKDGKTCCAVSPNPTSKVKIPSTLGGAKVTRIGERAFRGLDLTSVSIPASVTSIDAAPFAWCGKLTRIDVAADSHSFASVDGVLCTKDLAELVMCPPGLTTVTVPESVTTIREGAFHGCKRLAALTIPSAVKNIKTWAFSGCRGLTSVIIPASVTNMEDGAFWDCFGLTSVTMRGERPTAMNDIFRGCGKLKVIHVPANAKSWAGMKEWQGIPLVFDAE